MASSRLRRKLDVADAGEYGNVGESFVSIGTALPPLDDPKHKRDHNEFKPVWQQEVYDDQGRRRLHGAFTGGFSAGYYNTVGSKEGWTPSTFKSSRTNRAQGSQSNALEEAAKQFMDEEDLAELASSRSLETNKAYGVGTTDAAYDPLLGHFQKNAPPASSSRFEDTLVSMIEPSQSRVGLELMTKLGWRPGQGIGVRISRRHRQRQARELGLVNLEREEDGDEDEDDEASRHLFAPLDRPLVLVKGNTTSTERGWGLGYKPGQTLGAQLDRQGLAPPRRQVANGYDDDDDDDDDESGIMMAGDKKALKVFEDLDEDDRIATSSSRRRSGAARKEPATLAKAHVRSGPGSFHDGTPVLRGFSLDFDRSHLVPSTSQLPLEPPKGWKPDPSRCWNASRATDDRAKGKGRQLDAQDRGTLLGEDHRPPSTVPKSVFDYLSAKSRDRLASLTNKNSAAATASTTTTTAAARLGTEARDEVEAEVQLVVPLLDRPTALAALKGFQPYSAASTSPDPIKQARYTLYLQDQASGQASATRSPFGPREFSNGTRQTVHELNRELSEYSQSAKVFKPVTGMLGNRFETSKSGSLDTPKIEPGLYQPAPKNQTTTTTTNAASGGDLAAAPKLTPAQIAVREGTFGPLTRSTVPFRPVKLLCKRFGVKDPFEQPGGDESMGGGGGAGGAFGEATSTGWSTGDARLGTLQPIGDSAMEQMRQSAGFKQFEDQGSKGAAHENDSAAVAKGAFETKGDDDKKKSKPASLKMLTLETVGLGDDEAQGQEILDEEKAPADLFDLIFGGDSDDENENENDYEDGQRVEQDRDGQVITEEEAGETRAATALERQRDDGPAGSSHPETATRDSTTTTVPAAAVEPPNEPLTLDTISSYKPSFTARSSATATAADSTESLPSNSSKANKKKKPKRKAVALSFDVDEDEPAGEGPGGESSDLTRSTRTKRSRKESKQPSRTASREATLADRKETRQGQGGEEDEEEWAEAVSNVHPSILAFEQQQQQQQNQAERTATQQPAESKVRKPRMTASDLY